jgi:hypothetical protein
MEKFLTVAELYNACKAHKFLLLRFPTGYQMGVNCKVADIAIRRKQYKDTDETAFTSFKPCSLIEYIEHKHPY